MWIALRKGADDLLGRMVRLRTDSPYSHVELAMTGGPGLLSTCFSASWMDGGVRVKSIALGAASWDMVPVGVDAGRLKRIMDNEMGKPFDRTGMLLWGTAFADDHFKSQWFCSELMAFVLGKPSPWKYSPGSLYQAVGAGCRTGEHAIRMEGLMIISEKAFEGLSKGLAEGSPEWRGTGPRRAAAQDVAGR